METQTIMDLSKIHVGYVHGFKPTILCKCKFVWSCVEQCKCKWLKITHHANLCKYV
jgi:hypothetical protein